MVGIHCWGVNQIDSLTLSHKNPTNQKKNLLDLLAPFSKDIDYWVWTNYFKRLIFLSSCQNQIVGWIWICPPILSKKEMNPPQLDSRELRIPYFVALTQPFQVFKSSGFISSSGLLLDLRITITVMKA